MLLSDMGINGYRKKVQKKVQKGGAMITEICEICGTVSKVTQPPNALGKDVARVVPPPPPLAVLLEPLLPKAIIDLSLLTMTEHIVRCG